MSCNNTKSGSSKCTVILSVMYHRNVSCGFSYDLCALLIAGAFPLVSVVFRAIHFFICFCSVSWPLVEAPFLTMSILFKWHINSLLSLLSMQGTAFCRFGRNVLTSHTREAS
ncbi:hypothetical protein T09_13597 [Trichinella sp. T9]|nr:hypothetical protein T09_13597 [Trichinella sp. T9]